MDSSRPHRHTLLVWLVFPSGKRVFQKFKMNIIDWAKIKENENVQTKTTIILNIFSFDNLPRPEPKTVEHRVHKTLILDLVHAHFLEPLGSR